MCVMYIAIVCMLIHVARNLKFGGGDQRLYVCVHFRALCCSMVHVTDKCLSMNGNVLHKCVCQKFLADVIRWTCRRGKETPDHPTSQKVPR